MKYSEIMEKSKIISECDDLIEKISEEFKWFSEQYMLSRRCEVTVVNMKENIKNKLFDLSYEKQVEYNEMAKMFSEANCWYADYQAGRLVHDALIEIWND